MSAMLTTTKESIMKPKSSRTIVITAILTIFMFAILYHKQPTLMLTRKPTKESLTTPSTAVEKSAVEGLSQCGRIILVTAARHGSTWFISSAEGCTAKGSSSFGRLNRETELWVDHGSMLTDMPAADAVDYVYNNRSLKVMPLAGKRYKEIREFFRLVGKNIPVFVLRRSVEDCYRSLMEAKETRKWLTNKVEASQRGVDRQIVDQEQFEGYKRKLERFFDEMMGVLKDSGNVWDVVDYEDVSMQRFIVGRRNRCFIKNCNFE